MEGVADRHGPGGWRVDASHKAWRARETERGSPQMGIRVEVERRQQQQCVAAAPVSTPAPACAPTHNRTQGADVPKLFKHSGKIRNKQISKRETEKMVKEIWKERLADPGGLWLVCQRGGAALQLSLCGCTTPSSAIALTPQSLLAAWLCCAK